MNNNIIHDKAYLTGLRAGWNMGFEAGKHAALSESRFNGNQDSHHLEYEKIEKRFNNIVEHFEYHLKEERKNEQEI
jgi:hypothetical protein